MTVGTATKAPQGELVAFFSGPNFAAPQNGVARFERKDNGSLAVFGMPIFRSGSFMDSEGFPHEYDGFHMELIASNFRFLRTGGIFTDPPVRCGHPSFLGNPMRDLIGSVTNVYTAEMVSPADGEKYTYLIADFEVNDLQAAEKVESGAWKHRSAEIGLYITNSGMEFYPTLVGFAYVDIPAVEGLNFSKFDKRSNVSLIDSEQRELNMSGAKAQQQAPGQDSGGQTAPETPPASPAPDSAPQSSSQPGSQQPETFAAARQAHTFRIGGTETTDFSAVQAHIDELEQFQTETITTARENFVRGLAASNKILQAQVTGMLTLVKSYNQAQWDQFKALYETAATLPLLGEHAVAEAAGGTPAPVQLSDDDAKIAQAKRVVERHKMTGMAMEQIKATPSGVLLLSKGISF